MVAPTSTSLASSRHFLSEARHLAARGVSISFLVPHHYDIPFEEYNGRDRDSIDGVRVKHVYLPPRWRGARRTHLFPIGYWTWKLVRRALEEPFDIIHVMKPYYTSGSTGLALNLLSGKPLVLECDDLEGYDGWAASLSEEPLFGFKTRMIDRYECRLPRLADTVIANSLYLESMFRASGVADSRLHYIPYSVEDYMLRPGDGERIRRTYGLSGRGIAIYCGALHPHNYDCDLLIEAMRVVHGKFPDVTLLIVGDGGARPGLEGMAAEFGLLGSTVIFTGWVSHEDIPDYIAAANVAVVPMRDTPASKARGLSKVLEYLCQARPVVMPGIGQAAELTDGGKAGILVAAGSSDELAQGIIALISDHSLATEKGAYGKTYVRQAFNASNVTDTLLALYKGLASPR
jgi:glycosyltransferase involved in cell wall biosynthesis